MSVDDLREPTNPIRVLAAAAPLGLLVVFAVFLVAHPQAEPAVGAPADGADASAASEVDIEKVDQVEDIGPLPALLAPAGDGSAPSAAPRPGNDRASLKRIIERLRPLHAPFGAVEPGDWIEAHPEAGQSFAEWLEVSPRTALGTRKVIYVQPLGAFTAAQRRVVALTAELLGITFGLPVKTLPDRMVDISWPSWSRRVHPTLGTDQLHTSYILGSVLEPRLEDDAAALVAFTAHDLWPGEGWNFVFGMAALRERVGVWSIARNGDLRGGDAEVRAFLRRTFKTATHEVGHMFTMEHCTAYDCGMCGVNSLEEADRRPIWFCPECEAKLLLATGVDPRWRDAALARFFGRLGLEEESRFYARSAEAIGATR